MDIGDIIEREVDEKDVKAPEAPSAPKERTSRFRTWNNKAKPKIHAKSPPVVSKQQPPLSESEKIHLENVKKLAGMSAEDIANEREEIMKTFDPNILQALLKRAELKEEEMGSNIKSEPPKQNVQTQKVQIIETQNVSPFEDIEEDQEPQVIKDCSNDPRLPDPDLGVHFMKPTQQHNTEVGGESDFMEEMHQKYFPDLEVEESKLAWMKPVSEEEEGEYHPMNESLAPSELRFDFKGDLVTPRMSRDIPTTEGLHHHGDAPAAAGYTILELSHLARSTNLSQRCLSIRTLGRIIYRVRQGKFGSQISAALNGLLETGRVQETLLQAEKSKAVAEVAYAEEALWLWKSNNVRGAV